MGSAGPGVEGLAVEPAGTASPAFVRDMMVRSLHRHAERVALVFEDRETTYAELDDASDRLANALGARGIGKGDVVALLLRNAPEFVVAHLAILKLGAVRAPLNEMLAAEDVAFMLGHSGATALIAHASLGHLVPDAAPALRARILVPDAASQTGALSAFESPDMAFEPWADVLATASPHPPARPPVGPEDAAMILYTGGTTGAPKGVLHAQRALATNVLAQVLYAEIAPDERMYLCTPLPHSAHLFLEAGLLQGARITLAGGFDPAEVLRRLDADGITWLFVVPTMLYRLLDHPDRAGAATQTLRTVVYGASPITASRLSQALDAFGPVFVQLYGQTEVPNFIAALSKADHLVDAHRTSCGRASIFCDISVTDEAGGPLPAGEVGEVCVRGAYTLARYHDDPVRTAEAFRDGWLRTGDIGYLTPSGHLHLVDRAKDMIISGGMNVYSSEVENALQEHPSVRQVLVIGVPDDDWGEAVTAFVVRASPCEATELIAFARPKLARYKVPKRVEFLDAVPLTAYGKPDKKALRARFWGQTGRAVN